MKSLKHLFFVLVCLLLIFMVVITPSQSEGLAGAFGGMGSDSFFGTKAHQHISKFTVGLAVAFLVLAVVINSAAKRPTGKAGSVMDDAPASTSPVPTPPK